MKEYSEYDTKRIHLSGIICQRYKMQKMLKGVCEHAIMLRICYKMG